MPIYAPTARKAWSRRTAWSATANLLWETLRAIALPGGSPGNGLSRARRAGHRRCVDKPRRLAGLAREILRDLPLLLNSLRASDRCSSRSLASRMDFRSSARARQSWQNHLKVFGFSLNRGESTFVARARSPPPPGNPSSIKNCAWTTFPPAFATNLEAAAAVPPVASKSSINETRSPGSKAST